MSSYHIPPRDAFAFVEYEARIQDREDRLDNEARFREPTAAEIDAELLERARLLREHEDEQRRIQDEPLLTDELRDAAYVAYPELKGAEIASREIQQHLAEAEIKQLEKELESVRERLFSLSVRDLGADAAIVDFSNRFLLWIEQGCPFER